AFRVQYAVIPGRYTSEWFQPTRLGDYPLLCNQYCGMDHSRMYGTVHVIDDSEYARWLRDHARPGMKADESPYDAGRDLFQSQSCIVCHGAADTAKGPTLVGIFGTNRTAAD